MKQSKEARKEQTHAAILEAASRLVREKGVADLGVAEVMGAAGLTVGGFYSHFENKESLVREAMCLAFGQLRDGVRSRVQGATGRERLQSIVDWYASAEHRDCPEGGCVLPEVAGDLAREEFAALRPALADELMRYPTAVVEAVGDPALNERGVVACFLTLLGSIVLARAVRGTPLSDEILRVARETAVAAAYRASELSNTE